jgi:hypothetical protein
MTLLLDCLGRGESLNRHSYGLTQPSDVPGRGINEEADVISAEQNTKLGLKPLVYH